MNNWKICENVRDEKKLRNLFFDFVNTVFPSINFKIWYEKGYWTENYIPYSIVENNQIVANVSISKMDIWLQNKLIRGIQFGTVGTIPTYRNHGMSRYLMEYVLRKYERETDLFFLYANETVLDFYPKFEFTRMNECSFEFDVKNIGETSQLTKLNINNLKDWQLIKDLVQNRLPLTKTFGAANYGFITMWHILNIFPNDLYYLKDQNILVIYTIKNKQMHLWDVVFTKEFDFNLILPKILPNPEINKIIFHFPPDQLNFKFDTVNENEETLLHIKGKFVSNGIRFRFPTTAQT